jgi:hypothetical protein
MCVTTKRGWLFIQSKQRGGWMGGGLESGSTCQKAFSSRISILSQTYTKPTMFTFYTYLYVSSRVSLIVQWTLVSLFFDGDLFLGFKMKTMAHWSCTSVCLAFFALIILYFIAYRVGSWTSIHFTYKNIINISPWTMYRPTASMLKPVSADEQ